MTSGSQTAGPPAGHRDYSGTPLPRKLGIGDDDEVALIGAPDGFSDMLRALPEIAALHTDLADAARYDVIVCFCPDAGRLRRRWPVLHSRTTSAGALWIAWPKRASGVPTDLDENVVRGYALAHGRVDVKVCAVDDVWSGLKNVVRKVDR